MVEQLTLNQLVVGSSPSRGTILLSLSSPYVIQKGFLTFPVDARISQQRHHERTSLREWEGADPLKAWKNLSFPLLELEFVQVCLKETSNYIKQTVLCLSCLTQS
jgi:hypothetical protein